MFDWRFTYTHRYQLPSVLSYVIVMLRDTVSLEEKGKSLIIALGKERGQYFADAVEKIVNENIRKGRAEKWMNTSRQSLADYVLRVADFWEEYGEYLVQLQVDKLDVVWEPLYINLQKWAYRYFLRKSFVPGDETTELSRACAGEAATTLLAIPFPYDVAFDAWACRVLYNVCNHKIRETLKQSQIPTGHLVPFMESLFYPEQAGTSPEDLRLDMLYAVDQLSVESWKQVIVYRYYYNMKPADIADELGKSPSAVYNLQFKALAALREILMEMGHIYE